MINEVISESSGSDGGPPGFIGSSADENSPNELTDSSEEEVVVPKRRFQRLVNNLVPRRLIQHPARGEDWRWLNRVEHWELLRGNIRR